MDLDNLDLGSDMDPCFEGDGMDCEDKNVPPFLNKAFTLVSDPALDHFIRWKEDGKSFVICGSEELARQILPIHFKHDKLSSFIRQLNMYGFSKFGPSENMEFRNEYFQRGQRDLLPLIVRKRKQPGHTTALRMDSMNREVATLKRKRTLLEDEVIHLRGTQAAMVTRLDELERESDLLKIDLKNTLERQSHMQEMVKALLSYVSLSSGAAPLPLGSPPSDGTSDLLDSLLLTPKAAPLPVPIDEDEPPRKKRKGNSPPQVDIPRLVEDDTFWEALKFDNFAPSDKRGPFADFLPSTPLASFSPLAAEVPTL